MVKKFLFCCSVLLSFAIVLFAITNLNVEKMPLVKNDPYANLSYGASPIEQRDLNIRKWLAAGVKISVSGASGSGTIIYYNETDGLAYIQSCGHLWNGTMTANEGKRRNIKCTVTTWYHNDEKLSSPKTYNANVIYYNNEEGEDCSLLTFKPDWSPSFFPLAPRDFVIAKDTRFHSVGCDGGREIAHYDVRCVGMRRIGPKQSLDLVTTENSPRPGRSGGGLMSEDFYVAICWGTSDYEGEKNGFFTPIETIREFNQKNGYGWLNEMGDSLARRIPIIDRNGPQGKYPKNYIPLPNR